MVRGVEGLGGVEPGNEQVPGRGILPGTGRIFATSIARAFRGMNPLPGLTWRCWEVLKLRGVEVETC